MNDVALSVFAREVQQGLSETPKRLSSKWFYDERGDALFQAIMSAPEYYLTDCEREIFQQCGPDLLAATEGRPFDLVELGAGDGSKTQYLLEAFTAARADFRYRPIDISRHALAELEAFAGRRWPELRVEAVEGEYFTALDRLSRQGADRLRVVLFPGANIGNFTPTEARAFLRRLGGLLRPGDLLFIGFDLKKDPAQILAAYNDPGGHTAAFNLNLLRRINRELGGNIDVDNWRHWETYDPATGAAKSYLVPQTAVTLYFEAFDDAYVFEPFEPIAVEISQKYSRTEIAALAAATGYRVRRNFEDGRGWFLDCPMV